MSENVARKKALTPKQERAAAVLIAGGSKGKAADAVGVAVRTIERWMQDERFNEYLRQGAIKALQTASMRITALLGLALDVFYEAMATPTPKSGIKLRAANYTIGHAIRLMEISDILERLEAVETQLGIRQ